MNNLQQFTDTIEIANKVTRVLNRRLRGAYERFSAHMQKASEEYITACATRSTTGTPWTLWQEWYDYSVDFAQRSILFWDTLRQRGNAFVEHERAGKPPVLNFDYETIIDGRTLKQAVNYALVRIVPPQDVTIDAKRRPYIIIDPRAGHGPGIGGFKDDSQVGVALRAGHPVYFIIFYPEPEPGQTLLDVCEAEAHFVREVRKRHPSSEKPVIIGNCQGGWAAMMLASSHAEDTGPIVINGAPMSYWGGAWREGEGDNPMRYAGGLLGGTWLTSLTADLANGKFDGAHLVQNMENLNPANTLWDKYYHVFANVDTEPPRFLDFERWWGGFFLMNRSEIEWITQNLFVGNKAWTGEGKAAGAKRAKSFDLRDIRSPIILFASLGDNITPPQQAFNWIADVYGSTDEIKARGQTIVGLLHQNIGHLGIFVSGKVAKKEHTQIVSVLQSIEALPPGLYGMQIHETKNAEGKTQYDVTFVERRLEEVMERLNRFKRSDEKAFESVAAVSEFNQRAYELFARPLIQAMSSELGGQLQRAFHPLRFQRWAISDINPFLQWLQPAAETVQALRLPVEAKQPLRRAGQQLSEMVSASLDYYRDVRDAVSEAAFFHTYGVVFGNVATERDAASHAADENLSPRELPFVKAALAAISSGGYAEAIARIGALLAPKGGETPLTMLQTKRELIDDYRELLPQTTFDEQRRLRGEQDLIVRYEPEQAIKTLPNLLAHVADRTRLKKLIEKLAQDARMQPYLTQPNQQAMLAQIRATLGISPERPPAIKPPPPRSAERYVEH